MLSAVTLAVLLQSTTFGAFIKVGATCSLANALSSASSNTAVGGCVAGEASPTTDIVSIPAGSYHVGNVELTDSVELAGAGMDSTTLTGDYHGDGVGDYRILRSTAAATVVIRDLTMRLGKAQDNGIATSGEHGGAIFASGPLTLTRVALVGNRGGNGGPGTLGGTSGGGGGAVFSNGPSLVLRDCIVMDNSGGLGQSGSGLAGTGGAGGAIYATTSGMLVTIERSVFMNNTAGLNNNDARGSGGAVRISGAGSIVTVQSSHFEGNVGSEGTLQVTNGTLEVIGSSFTEETTRTSDGVIWGRVMQLTARNTTIAHSTGHAILATHGATPSTVEISHSTIVGNTGGVASTGAALVTVTNSIVAGNDIDCTEAVPTQLFFVGPNIVSGSCPGGSATVVVSDTELFTQVLESTPLVFPNVYDDAVNALFTYPLLPTSLARDAASCGDVDGVRVAVDQRGEPRPATGCDIGAYEALAAGSEGPEGPAGPAGPAGSEGPEGPQGPAGSEGPEGPVGSQGSQGERGDNGAKGDDGAKGRDGGCAAGGDASVIAVLGAMLLGRFRRRSSQRKPT